MKTRTPWMLLALTFARGDLVDAQGTNPFALSLAPRSAEVIVSSGSSPCSVRILDSVTGDELAVISHPSWKPVNSRAVAVSADDHLWVLGDDLLGAIYEFDSQNALVGSFVVDTSAAGTLSGAGLRSLVFGPNGNLFAVGGWSSGGTNMLFEVDPLSGATLGWVDLDALGVGKFEPSRIGLSPWSGDLLVTEWNGGGRILRFDPSSLSPIGVHAGPGSAHLADVTELWNGRLVVGVDEAAGGIFEESPGGGWQLIAACSGPGAYAVFDLTLGRIFADSGACGVAGDVAVLDASGGMIGTLSVAQGACAPSGVYDIAVRY